MEFEKEVWRRHPIYAHYFGSSLGRIKVEDFLIPTRNTISKAIKPGKVLSPLSRNGAFSITVSYEGRRIFVRVCDFIYDCFKRNRNGLFPIFKDGNVTNCSLSNLRFKSVFAKYKLKKSHFYPIKGFSDYVISKTGIVLSPNSGVLIKTFYQKPPINCMAIRLINNKKAKIFTLYRLLALTFIPNPENKAEVHHIDYNRMNHKLSNLMWLTKLENIRDAFNKGVMKAYFKPGFDHSQSRMTPEKLRYMLLLREQGASIASITKQMGYRNTWHVSRILKGEIYGK